MTTTLRRARALPACVILAVAACAPTARAAAFTPGNVLVASQQQLIEYTREGVAVRTVGVPVVAGSLSGLHDLMVDRNGNVQIYNGTSPAVLTQYDPVINSFSHQPDTFSVVNVLGFGGLVVAGDFVYVTDWDTGGSPGTGLVRFRVGGGGPTTVVTPGQYMDLTLGRDGKLYALRNDGIGSGGATVDAFNPVTGAALGSIRLAADASAIAVDAAGDFYAVDQDNPITHFDRTGAIVKTMPDPVGGLVDIDINAQDELVLASHSGEIAFTTTRLESLTRFNHRHQTDQNFVAWADPGLPVPEPSSTAALVMAGAALALDRRCRERERELERGQV